MNAEQDGLNKAPSFPQGLPTWKAITRAGQKAAKAGNGTAEVANCPLLVGARVQESNDTDDLLGNDQGRRLIGNTTRLVAQMEQTQSDGRQESQQVLQRADRVHAVIFQATATFEDFMKLFNEPTAVVPADPFPGIFDHEDWHAGQQQPFKRLNASRGQGFPHSHDPQAAFRFQEGGVVDGRPNAHLFEADLDDRIAGGMSVGRGQCKHTDILSSKLASTALEME